MLLLVPFQGAASKYFHQVNVSPRRYERLLAEMQRFRGRLYVQDGAIEEAQLTSGKHQLETDEDSWHLLILNAADEVCGCIRYRELCNQADFSELGVAKSGLAASDRWRHELKSAVEAELSLSRR